MTVSKDHFLASVVANTLTKLVLRAMDLDSLSGQVKNALNADVMLILTHMLLFGRSTGMDKDCYDRISACLYVLAKPSQETRDLFLKYCRESFSKVLAEKKTRERSERVCVFPLHRSSGCLTFVQAAEAKRNERVVAPDTLISLRQLGSRADEGLSSYGMQRCVLCICMY